MINRPANEILILNATASSEGSAENLRNPAVSPEPSLLAYRRYGSIIMKAQCNY